MSELEISNTESSDVINDGTEDASRNQVEQISATDTIQSLRNSCDVAYADLTLCGEMADTIVIEDEIATSAAEIIEINAIKAVFCLANEKLMNLLRETQPEQLCDVEQKRRNFLMLHKNIRNKLLQVKRKRNSDQSSETSSRTTLASVRLPKVNIPIFNGDIDKWVTFKNLFMSLINQSDELDDVTKHNYLRSLVCKEPLHLIQSLPLSGEYYNAAIDILLKHYDDPVRQIATHLNALHNAKGASEKGVKFSLRELIVQFRQHVSGLQILLNTNVDIDPLSQCMIHLFLLKADKATRTDWEQELGKSKKFSTFTEFVDFMDTRCAAFERVNNAGKTTGELDYIRQRTSGRNNVVLTTTANQSKEQYKFCIYCRNRGHFIPSCNQFKGLVAADRLSFVKKRRLCIFCFRGNCNVKLCSRRHCQVCKGKHNTLVHVNNNQPELQGKKNTVLLSDACHVEPLKGICPPLTMSKIGYINDLRSKRDDKNTVILHARDNYSDSLLATVLVKIVEPNSMSRAIEVRALLDSGSQPNFITADFIKKLNLNTYYKPHALNALSGLNANSNYEVEIKIQSLYSQYQKRITCIVLNNIVSLLPQEYFSVSAWNIPSHVSLADPHFNIPGDIDLLLGVGIFWDILSVKKISLGANRPILWESKFGWLVTGEMQLTSCLNSKFVFFAQQARDELLKSVERFWLLEEISEKPLSQEESDCENIFLATTTRDSDGRFRVRLPFKESTKYLGDSREQALKRFNYLERRFSNNEKLNREYVECIQSYISLGHMKKICEKSDVNDIYYIPHHAVIKDTSTSTKLRVVFDASMKTSTGVSLNDNLLVGPVVQPDLFSTIIRFRLKKWVFVADISKMYRQIWVHQDDTRFQRIFWRESENEPVSVYELKTVTFGTSSAPFLATRCLKYLAENYCDQFPAARTALLYDFYVDDVLSGADNIESALHIQHDLIEVLKGAGFELNKWCSNTPKLLTSFPKEKLETQFPLSLGEKQTIKTLGVLWLPTEDCFKIWIHFTNLESISTKRQILSVIASIFDPFGLVGPVTVKAKIFMQLLWQTESVESHKKSLNWDEKVPEPLLSIWMEFASQLESLKTMSVPRYLLTDGKAQFIEVHSFCDASERAYGAVVYLRSSGKGKCTIKLVCSKSRVAPLKKLSLPRLELCGALLLAELTEKIIKILQLSYKISIVRLWTDSTIVLSWLASPALRWQTFVANRVQKIQNICSHFLWDHVASPDNPADPLSRGILPNDLQDCKIWWRGPKWLDEHNEPWSKNINFRVTNPPQLELRKTQKISALAVKGRNELFERYSNYPKLLAVTAFLIRFNINSHAYGPKVIGSIKCFELEAALTVLVKVAQEESFGNDLKSLRVNNEVIKNSPLKNLAPFIDNFNVLRVGGRLEFSNLSFEQRHQTILSPKHPLTDMIIRYEHLRHLHAGPQLLRSVLRRKFWILRVNNAVKRCIAQCVKCARMKANTITQMMANLPSSRVIPSKPFTITGVDYTGAVQLLERVLRQGQKVTRKAYIAVFVCFTTKAIHLELVSDLSSEAFLAALDRFISRRGIPLEVHSDNGTNFVGAKSELQRLREFFKKENVKIEAYSNKKGFQWYFSPPYAPHFGGLWEAGVKSVKRHLRSVLYEATLNYEQYATVLAQVEACLNSRPLIPESCDPNDLNALTPGHFLIGGPITAVPNPNLIDVPKNRLKHWEKLKQMTQIFWKRWSHDYLNTLQQRTKWKVNKNDLKLGDLVLVKEDNVPPAKWCLGRVLTLHPGSDGHTRVVTLKTATANIKRPIAKLVFLPINTKS